MFYIVEFTDEKACEIVPESWFLNGNCAWPNSNDSAKIRSAVQKSRPPKRSWRLHAFRVLHRYETYELALGQLDYAMQESDLSDYETARKKRKPDREEPNDEYIQQHEVVDPEPVARVPTMQLLKDAFPTSKWEIYKLSPVKSCPTGRELRSS
ncbi:unnamed protein product [Orchesella dallaii]|uniref:Uncharacterized protein n=1 Tax=Orchesella dallaii TaxID=48710 RepID=A0ABP1PLB1_9HEXA